MFFRVSWRYFNASNNEKTTTKNGNGNDFNNKIDNNGNYNKLKMVLIIMMMALGIMTLTKGIRIYDNDNRGIILSTIDGSCKCIIKKRNSFRKKILSK